MGSRVGFVRRVFSCELGPLTLYQMQATECKSYIVQYQGITEDEDDDSTLLVPYVPFKDL